MQLTEPERDAILVGLRLLQHTLEHEPGFPGVHFEEIYTDGGAHPGLRPDDIDTLCEQINSGEVDVIEANEEYYGA